jgi:hypothetical protein
VREVFDIHEFEEIPRADVVEDAAKDSVVDLQVLGGEHLGCPEPVFELGWNPRVELDDLVVGRRGGSLHNKHAPGSRWFSARGLLFSLRSSVKNLEAIDRSP